MTLQVRTKSEELVVMECWTFPGTRIMEHRGQDIAALVSPEHETLNLRFEPKFGHRLLSFLYNSALNSCTPNTHAEQPFFDVGGKESPERMPRKKRNE